MSDRPEDSLSGRNFIARRSRKHAISRSWQRGATALLSLRGEILESRRMLAVDTALDLTATSAAVASQSVAGESNPSVNFQSLYSLATDPTQGGDPQRAPLVAFGTKLYGMTDGEGATENGVIFSVNDDGSDFQVLHSFGPSFEPDASSPGLSSGLTLIGSTLYGTTEQGGSRSNDGALFSISLDGSNYQILHAFLGGASDGATPDAAPILVGSVLYGTTSAGGSAGYGTVYSINPDGSNFQILHTFLGAQPMVPIPIPN